MKYRVSEKMLVSKPDSLRHSPSCPRKAIAGRGEPENTLNMSADLLRLKL